MTAAELKEELEARGEGKSGGKSRGSGFASVFAAFTFAPPSCVDTIRAGVATIRLLVVRGDQASLGGRVFVCCRPALC